MIQTSQESFGLRIWQGEALVMGEAHQHNEIEMNFVTQGFLEYFIAGSQVKLKANHLAFFWAAIPHRLVNLERNTRVIWLTLPLSQFLRWQLPKQFVNTLLYGKILQSSTGTSISDFDAVQRWLHTLKLSADHERVMLLELEARLLRLALELPTQTAQENKHTPGRAAELAAFIAEHYQETISARDIAKAVGLNANYAATLFREGFGLTLTEYLTSHRIAHAQRLLATTEQTVLEISLEAGFVSSSQFYTAFVKACGRTPLAYKKSLR
jgi:AraC family transcriptional regulator, melibiose operon regulatory protein